MIKDLAISAKSFIFVAICSKSSFLYPINDWGDVNTYFTIGKGMLAGKVPYRDLYDQKGVVIFALQALGAIISYDSCLYYQRCW